jgi:Spy/CpxP family protein refolding chaperone
MLVGGFVAVFGVASAHAQGPPPMPFGPGGMGAPGGPSLVMAAPVQEELALTGKQKEQLRKLESTMMRKGRDAFEQGDGDPETMRSVMDSLRRQRDGGIAKVLDKTQKARLAQIELQREGLLAVSKPEIASKLKLTSAQTKQVRSIVAQMRESMASAMPPPPGGGPPQGGGFPGPAGPPRGNRAGGEAQDQPGEGFFPGGGPPPDGGPPPGGGDFPGGPPPGGGAFGGGGPPPGGPPNFDSPEFRARFAKMRETMENARAAAIKKISSVLTSAQKEAFDKMLGKPFDLSKLRMGPGPGGPPGQGPARNNGQAQPNSPSRRRGAPVDE